MCSLLFCLSFRLKSNKELLESNFSIVGKLAVRLLIHVIIGDTSLLQLWSTVHKFKVCDWQKRMQNWINLIACKCNYLNIYLSTKTQQATILSIQNPDNKYVCGIFLGSIQILKICTEQNRCGSFECPYAHSI